MNKSLTLYHGSSLIIEQPEFGKGNPFNDYGLGFYCTQTLELAKEWACSMEQDGYANRYSFCTDSLSILNLSDENYNILNWLSILLMNRRFNLSSDIAAQGREYLASTFLLPYENYDVIIGYRADDSYFSFASAFLNNTISLAQLEKAMFLGKLGEQVVLKSEKAFSRLCFEESIPAERTIYYPKKATRDSEARAASRAERKADPVRDAVYMIDILREEWKNDDARLRGNLPE
ncbi:DUF3990 domain-containing protein [Lachnoclostridium sp. An138]|uniref:DUF3990 domain-containing protein n=1 Tax=Lachnoclostridium sp. An138 TaxID=1965560 RepID=UPI000B3A1643|nr:DUF3990 domain-containing protein [Lachnoclostridium sp. An138]OUQ19609.1 hypothetical protein B5E82_05170 [Lachnoclostridium sp. An138]